MIKIREWVSVKIVKAPKMIVLLGILAANLFFISIAALIVMSFAPASLETNNYWNCVYYALTMFLSGYMETAVDDIGQAGALFVMFCVCTVILGMVVFTGAVIGYMSEFISGFIENADSSSRKLRISGHIVILNWNSRAAEIINELLYKSTKEKVVVLVDDNREDVIADIDERLSATIDADGIKNKLTVIVREGDSWSAKQLNGISIKSAKSVIILSNDMSSADGGFERTENGNAHTVKTLLQVMQMVAEEDSATDQKIIVEIEDDWTLKMVNTIITRKARTGNDNIAIVAVNRVLGQIFSQFSIMPELNTVYSTLLSNKSTAFYTHPATTPSLSETEFITTHLDSHLKSIPLTVMRGDDGKLRCYYMSDDERHIHSTEPVPQNNNFRVSLNPDFEMANRHVVILGHNSKSASIMEGFEAFCAEWKKKDGTGALDVIAIDDDALTCLILVQDIIHNRRASDPGFNVNMVVEILDPKNYDIVSNYSADNIVISNRYISKIIMQIGEKDSLFDFYSDILTYDEPGEEEADSKELYIKEVFDFFNELPEPCTAAELIRAVYYSSPEDNKSIVLGYFRADGEMILFKGDQSEVRVNLSGEDKLILFSNH